MSIFCFLSSFFFLLFLSLCFNFLAYYFSIPHSFSHLLSNFSFLSFIHHHHHPSIFFLAAYSSWFLFSSSLFSPLLQFLSLSLSIFPLSFSCPLLLFSCFSTFALSLTLCSLSPCFLFLSLFHYSSLQISPSSPILLLFLLALSPSLPSPTRI